MRCRTLSLSLLGLAVHGLAAEAAAPDTLVVTATRVESEVATVPADATVADAERLDRTDRGMFTEALSDVPGVKLTARQPRDPAITGIEVRGMGTNQVSGNNVTILLDGIPQRRLSYGGPYLGALPQDAVVRMELVKGPLGALYGRGAIAGALHLFTDPGSSEPQVRLRSQYDSATATVLSAIRASGPLGDSGATGSFSASSLATDGWQPYTDGHQQDAYMHLRIPLGEHDRLSLLAGAFQGDRNAASPVPITRNGGVLPGASYDGNLAVPGHNRLELSEYRVGLVWERDWSEAFATRFTGAYWQADTLWLGGRLSDGPAPGSTVVRRYVDRQELDDDALFGELQARHRHRLGTAYDGTTVVGAAVERWTTTNDYRTVGWVNLDLANPVEPDPSTWVWNPATVRDVVERNLGVFLREQALIAGRIDATAGIRYDTYIRSQENRTTGANSKVDNHALTPSVALGYRLVDADRHHLSLYASWGRGFSPTYRGASSAEIVDVDPERSESIEVGLKGSAADHAVEGSLVAYRLDRTDVVGPVPGTTPVQYDNIGDWRVSGIELGLACRPLSGLTLAATGTVRDPEITAAPDRPATVGNVIHGAARRMATLSTSYQTGSGLGGGIDWTYVGTAFAEPANVARLPSYELVDVWISYDWRSWSLGAFCNNVFDREYFTDTLNSQTNGAAFAGPPRSFGSTVTARF